MQKTLVLSRKEEKELKTTGSVIVERKGISYGVSTDNEGKYIIEALPVKMVVVLPLSFGKKSIILTHNENKELMTTGTTTHTKAGIKYIITRDFISGNIKVIVDNEYSSVLFISEC